MPNWQIFEPSLPPIESEGGVMSGTNRLLSIHFGFPEIGAVVERKDVRWKRKLWTEEDLAHPIFGARSMMYIAPSRAAQSGEGIDDVDFARQGLPDTDAGDDAEWGL